MSSTINASTASGGGLVTSADATGILQLQTAGTTALTINASQNVGIGTSSPGYKLDMTGQGRATTGWAVSGDGSAFTPSGLNAIPNYGIGYITSGNLVPLAGFSGIPFYTNQLERMRIDSSGNVGIGTVSPLTKLSVYSTFNAGSNGSYPAITGTGAYGGGIGFIDGVATSGIYTQSAGTELQFYTGQLSTDSAVSKVKMSIIASGNVGIGTSSPASRLDISSSLNAGQLSPLTFSANNSVSAKTNYVQFVPSIEFNPSGNEAGGFTLKVLQGGAYKNIIVASGALINTSNYLALGTTNEALRIDSSGRVTMPYQPAFKAHISGSPSIAYASILPFNVVSYNIGNHYNTSTSLFTAPVSGVYLFGGMIRVVTTNGYLHLIAQVNGVASEQNGELPGLASIASGTGFSAASFAYARYMIANDTIAFQIHTATNTTVLPHSQSYLYGHLLS